MRRSPTTTVPPAPDQGSPSPQSAPALAQLDRRIPRVRSRQCQGFPRNPGRFHPESGLSPSLDQLGAIEREASFL